MKILLLGKNGQVGWELQRALAPLGELVALDRQGAAGLCGDLADLERLRQTIRSVQPDVIVNAAAYTAVDKAQSQPELAEQVNAGAPRVMAEEMQQCGGWLVHYSTDYVFDGSGNQPWRETDQPAPLNHYGLSKLHGEQAIAQSGCQHLIFRTSWVYAARGGNFAKTMLRLATEREQLSVIADQFGAPTGAELIADVTAHALRTARGNPQAAGLYHLAAAGEVSWHGYAAFVIDQARQAGRELAVRAIAAIPSSDYPTPAPRPLNSRLDCHKLCGAFDLQLPDWQAGVVRMLNELQGN
ncbi:dTDP-4-dehydrorhamnose reductase [Pseudomonas sp. N040]|uniref:dTDP-4-dehydrorhamnose reductase n=1 Tax=Pseudomonas sp. N040 TaxID=2785325 RepID=UPI0018A2ADB0|nr:dTDP-4-dehydrorhamnose reductase [Pseudomonas sp. N040]MBF7729305.1 dTDP-4-dehydrorhamnose reductase [Pseudomonas sp. N040]MBW7012945.1 dTDP-4-dehydrorhamnose reductase [Pseudomonas sp. N040]